MNNHFGSRFKVEIVLATIAGILCLITPICSDWIETLSGWDLDQHDGTVEWLIAGTLLLVAVTLFAVAAIEWRRPPVAAAL